MQGLNTARYDNRPSKPINLNDTGFEEQFDKLCKLMEAFHGRPVRVGLQSLDKPKKPDSDETDYPFYGYNIVSARKVQVEPFEESDEEKITRKVAEQWEFTITVGCISDDMFVSMDGAQKLAGYLSDRALGRLDLKRIGQAFVAITPITQRDAFLVVSYERRYGFEITIRMGRVQTIEVVYIEKATATGTYIGVKEE